jgi:hypothetical protein
VPALRVALSVTFESFALRRFDAAGAPVPIDLGLAEYVLAPKIREELLAGTVMVDDEEGEAFPMTLPSSAPLYLNADNQSGGTSRYWRANLAISAKAGAATTPPQIAPRGSSTVTSMTSRGSFAGTRPTKEAT